MSKNPLAAKLAAPYARALYDFSIQKNLMHQITADFQNLETFLNQTPDLVTYLNNPLIGKQQKAELLDKTLKTQLNNDTFKFLNVLVKRDRINLLESVIENYLALVYDLAAIKIIEVSAASELPTAQKDHLTIKLKELTNAREIRLVITIDSSLIGGLVIKTNSKVIDFSVKNQLQLLAKHLDSVLDI
jgi:F-type H+-transporting ATPase subunit delta